MSVYAFVMDPSQLSRGGLPDVRMHGFRHRKSVVDAWNWVSHAARPIADSESVPLPESRGRVLASSVVSPADVPGFDRGMMDGFAVRSGDVQGASPQNPLELEIVGEAFPGAPCSQEVRPGTCIRSMTGAPLPSGADAVLPVEYAEYDSERMRALGSVPPGKHVGRRGEDIRRGAELLPTDRVLRPQDLGVLASVGVSEVQVRRRPRVAIVITGNEVLPAGVQPRGHQIVDANGPMLEALVARDGGISGGPDYVRDDPAAIGEALRRPVDVVLVSGGSSVGAEDYAPRILAEEGELAIHGIAMRPSSPAGMGTLGERLVFLLPGNPVSCLCAYDFFAGMAVRLLGGRSPEMPYRTIRAPLCRKLSSEVGRTDYARVRLVDGEIEPIAISGASILRTTVEADGFVIIAEDSEGMAEGDEAILHLYD